MSCDNVVGPSCGIDRTLDAWLPVHLLIDLTSSFRALVSVLFRRLWSCNTDVLPTLPFNVFISAGRIFWVEPAVCRERSYRCFNERFNLDLIVRYLFCNPYFLLIFFIKYFCFQMNIFKNKYDVKVTVWLWEQS